ncbi:iron-containing redox enzyme family protein [Pseudomonas protegens]|uniref:iron-containing redox enzyme family protein n=1 Tax=Pseudomonas protegens TaxID=380021 RepID=UPI00277385A0|nr:iron-containing redox enzyme family protein [Pseudomonas protegens]MDP9530562.1 iron-containing redox enzyme family protein [Pseudomonas protegens]
MDIYLNIRDCLYSTKNPDHDSKLAESISKLEDLAVHAFSEHRTQALLDAHRTLYVINMAHLSRPWESIPHNISHPLIARVKHTLESAWEQAERKKNAALLNNLPAIPDFADWVVNLVQDHSSHGIHPLYCFLRDEADFKQLREFTLQETPLEMLFGDIVALMMPGVYGEAKIELVKNFWDEVGHADDAKVHRNLRGHLMAQLDIHPDFYQTDVEVFVVEELALINMYLSMAMNRAKLTQLIGTMLATELMIPGRFEYLISGWSRLGLKDSSLAYHREHISVDAEHAQDWLYKVVLPMLKENPKAMGDLVLGVVRRLDTALAVSERLLPHIKNL